MFRSRLSTAETPAKMKHSYVCSPVSLENIGCVKAAFERYAGPTTPAVGHMTAHLKDDRS